MTLKIIDFHVHIPFDVERKGVNPKEIAENLIEWDE